MRNYNLKQFIKNFNNKKVYYDKAFQRRVVWTPANINKYFESLTRDWALQCITVADVEACRDHCKEVGELSSCDYFEEVISKGYKYISLDGQNRTKQILRFFSNLVTISGEFLDADNEPQRIQNTFFKDLESRLQDHLKTGCNVTVQTVEKATKDDLSRIFQALNDGQPLNDQEMRQATKTPVATWVRRQSQKYTAMLQRITTADHITRMRDDENLAKISMALMKKYNDNGTVVTKDYDLGSSNVDEWYEKGVFVHKIEDPSSPYMVSEVKAVEDILRSISAVINHQKEYPQSKIIPKRMWWATVAACEWAYHNGFEIQNNQKFFATLKTIDDKLYSDSETLYLQARQAAIKAGKDPLSIIKQGYYFRSTEVPHHSHARRGRSSRLAQEMQQHLNKLTLRKKAATIIEAAN